MRGRGRAVVLAVVVGCSAAPRSEVGSGAGAAADSVAALVAAIESAPRATLRLTAVCATPTAAPSALDLALTFTSSTSLILELPDRVFDASGMAALVEAPRAHDSLGPLPLRSDASAAPTLRLLAARPPVGPVTVSYRARSVPVALDGARFGLRHDHTGIGGSGAFFLLLPQPAPAGPTEVSWTSSACASAREGHAPSVVQGSLDDLRMRVYASGRAPTLAVDRPPLHLRATWLGSPAFDLREATDFAAAALAAERALFRDTDPAPYHLFVRALPAMGERSNGMGQPDSLLLAIGPATPGRPRLRINLAHEMMHRWIGLRLRLAGPEGTAFWLTEGFTVYYTVQVLRRAELLTLAEVEGELRQITDRYFAHPRRGATNAEIAAGFFDDPALSILPYVRGALYAAELDAAIIEASGGARSLDDLMRAWLERVRHAPVGPSGMRELDEAELRAGIAGELGAAGVDRIVAVIHGGARPEPASTVFGPCFERRDAAEGYRWGRSARCPRDGPSHPRIPVVSP